MKLNKAEMLKIKGGDNWQYCQAFVICPDNMPIACQCWGMGGSCSTDGKYYVSCNCNNGLSYEMHCEGLPT